MSAWIEAFPIEVPFDLRELSQNPIDPRWEIHEDHDTVIGDMNDEEKLVFSLWQRCEEETARAGIDMRYSKDAAEERPASLRRSKMLRLGTIFQQILWTMVWDRVGGEHENIGLAQDFKIITSVGGLSLMDLLMRGREPASSTDR